jgi:succinoglycan biosynthesis transport protein ExoP
MSQLSPYLIRHSQPIRHFPQPPRERRAEMADGIGMNEIWRVIRKRLWLTAPLVIAMFVIASVILLVMTPKYTGEATLLIEPAAPQVLNMTELIGDTAGDANYDYYKTEFELLKSRDVAARVIQDLQLSNDPLFKPAIPQKGSFAARWNHVKGLTFAPFTTQAVDESSALLDNSVDPSIVDAYLSHLKIKPVPSTRLVTVDFSLPDPLLAARVANTHVNDFVKQEQQIRSSTQRVAENFLRAQLVDISKQTERAEAELYAYRRRNGVLSFEVNDTNNLGAQRMSQLTRALTEAETRRIAAESQMQLVDHGDYDSLPQVVNNPMLSALKPQLVVLETEYARLSAAFNPTYPKLMELKAQLYQDRREIAVQMRNAANAVRREYRAALIEETRLGTEVQAEKARDLALNDALLKDAVLSRVVQTNQNIYKSVLGRMKEMAVASQTPLSNISIVGTAIPPRSPSSPRTRLDLAIVTLLALLMGLGLSFVMEQLDNRLRTPEEIEEYLNLPSLAVVPDFTKLAQTRVMRRRALPADDFDVVATARGARPGLDGYTSGASEYYRGIRTSLLFSRAGSHARTMLFASSIESEGKTWTAIHTAAALAQTGAATLLVSSDLRRPRCDKILNCEGTFGLSDTLTGYREPEEVIRRIDKHGFFFLSAGSRVPNPSELLTSLSMRQIIDSLAKRYVFLLFDSAPLMYASESIALAAMVDGVVIVIGAHTPKQSVRAACDRLAMVDAKILGVVLNGVDASEPEYRQYQQFYSNDGTEDLQSRSLTPVTSQ